MEDGQLDALVQIKQEPLDIVDTGEDVLNDEKCMDYVSNDYVNGIVFKQEPTDDEMVDEQNFNQSIVQDAVQTDTLPLFVQVKEKFEECKQTANDTLEVVDEREDFITVNAAEYQRKPNELIKPPCSDELQSLPSRPRKLRCPLCQKRFDSNLLAGHNKLHGRNLIFCQSKTCFRCFDAFEDCEMHEYQQHNIIHCKCNVCNHKFLTFDAMREHKEKMHGKLKRIVCSVCREWFISQDELQEHWAALTVSCGRLLQFKVAGECNANTKGTKLSYALQHVKPVTKIPIQKLRIKRRVMLTDIIKTSTGLLSAGETVNDEQFIDAQAQQTKKRARLSLPVEVTSTRSVSSKSFCKIIDQKDRNDSLNSKKRAPSIIAYSRINRDIHNFASLRNSEQMPALYSKTESLNEIESRENRKNVSKMHDTEKEQPITFIKTEALDEEDTLDADESREYIENAAAIGIKDEILENDAISDISCSSSTIKIKEEPLDTATDQINTNSSAITNIKEELLDEEETIVSVKQEPLYDYQDDQKIYSATKNIPRVRIKPNEQAIDARSNSARISTTPTAISIARKESLSSELARRITSKFSLKAVPKAVQLPPQVKVVQGMPTAPIIATKPAIHIIPTALVTPVPSTQPRKTHDSNLATLLTPGANKSIASKILKLSPNMKIVKFSPETKPHLFNVVAPQTTAGLSTALTSGNAKPVDKQPNINGSVLKLDAENSDSLTNLTIEFTTIKGQKLFGNRNFTLKKIELPTSESNDAVSSPSSFQTTESAENDKLIIDTPDVEETNVCDSSNSLQVLEDGGIPSIFDAKEELDNSREVYGYETAESLSASLKVKQTGKRNLSKSGAKQEMVGSLICHKCHRICSSRAVMRDHINSDCGRKPPHECHVCHKSFFSASTLNCHRSIHTGELPHKCDYCDKRFRTRGQVTVHHRTHTGERPFVCEVCMQGFTHRETLIAHLTRHIGMKRYKCYGCGKQFSCISGLSMHRSNRPYTCGKVELNTRAIGPRVRVIRGQVVFEPQPEIDSDSYPHSDDAEVLTEIQNK